METQATKILSAKEVRERAAKTRKERLGQQVSELDGKIAEAIEAAHVDSSSVAVNTDGYPSEVVHRTISRLLEAEYSVEAQPASQGVFSGKGVPTLTISWSQ